MCPAADPRAAWRRAHGGPAPPQVFEYLDTDLKKFMDLTGRGSANPLPPATVQVRREPRARARDGLTRRTVPQNFMYQLCIGIAHLHRHGVMHRREPRALPSHGHR